MLVALTLRYAVFASLSLSTLYIFTPEIDKNFIDKCRGHLGSENGNRKQISEPTATWHRDSVSRIPYIREHSNFHCACYIVLGFDVLATETGARGKTKSVRKIELRRHKTKLNNVGFCSDTSKTPKRIHRNENQLFQDI